MSSVSFAREGGGRRAVRACQGRLIAAAQVEPAINRWHAPWLAALHSLIHSGLFQAASAFRKTFNLKGRNFRFE
jgi:hypothetical protein